MQDNRYIELLLGQIAARGAKRHWFDSVMNAIGFIIVLGFVLLMVFGHYL